MSFTVDFRDMDLARRNALEKQLLSLIEETCLEHGLTYTIREDTKSDPRYCAPELRALMQEQAAEMGLEPPELMSGPFHDSLTMSYVCDYGMIFVRCKEGISHNPKEYSSPEDIELGVELLYRTARRLSE